MFGAPIDVMSNTPTTTVVDGNWGFGYVVTEEVMRRTIEKAKTVTSLQPQCFARAM